MTTTASVNLKTSASKKLLERHKLPMDAATLNNGLILAGVLETKTYLSTTGSGEEKSFVAFTTAGQEFGRNAAGSWHEFKTEPKYFEHRFAETYLLAATAILTHAHSAF